MSHSFCVHIAAQFVGTTPVLRCSALHGSWYINDLLVTNAGLPGIFYLERTQTDLRLIFEKVTLSLNNTSFRCEDNAGVIVKQILFIVEG